MYHTSMKKWLILIVLLLTACLPVTTSPGYDDPYTLREYGESLQAAADAQIEATSQAQMLEQQRKAGEVQSTQQAWALQVTQTTYAQSVQQTIEAGQVLETQRAMQTTQEAENAQRTQSAQTTENAATAQAVSATSEAIALQVKYEQELMSKKTFWVGAREAEITLFTLTMLLLTGIGLYKFSKKYIPIITDWIIEWIDRRNTLFDGRSGTTAFILTPDGQVKPMLLANVDHYRDRPMLDTPISKGVNQVTLSANKISATSPLQNIPERTLQISAIEYMRKCEPNSNQLISCERSGINRMAWMQITDSMENAGLIYKEPDKGTYVIDGTCRDVLYALETKQVVLSPAPPRYTPVEQLKCSETV